MYVIDEREREKHINREEQTEGMLLLLGQKRKSIATTIAQLKKNDVINEE